jgi:hypothetical protein
MWSRSFLGHTGSAAGATRRTLEASCAGAPPSAAPGRSHFSRLRRLVRGPSRTSAQAGCPHERSVVGRAKLRIRRAWLAGGWCVRAERPVASRKGPACTVSLGIGAEVADMSSSSLTRRARFASCWGRATDSATGPRVAWQPGLAKGVDLVGGSGGRLRIRGSEVVTTPRCIARQHRWLHSGERS